MYVCLWAGGGEEIIFASCREREFVFPNVTCPNSPTRDGMIFCKTLRRYVGKYMFKCINSVQTTVSWAFFF